MIYNALSPLDAALAACAINYLRQASDASLAQPDQHLVIVDQIHPDSERLQSLLKLAVNIRNTANRHRQETQQSIGAFQNLLGRRMVPGQRDVRGVQVRDAAILARYHEGQTQDWERRSQMADSAYINAYIEEYRGRYEM